MILYLLFAAPALLLGLYAQAKVKGNFKKYSKVRTFRNLTGATVARQLLNASGLGHVEIERTQGRLSDHYDPRSKVLRLSPDVYDSPSVAAAGIAAHEMGHALQDAENYGPLTLRSAMVPAVQYGSWLGPIIFLVGFFMNFTGLAWAGVALFGAIAIFALVTLPVEYDASRRAKKLLVNQGFLASEEMVGVNKVLNAAALTYVAAAISAIMTLLYYAYILMGRRD